MHRKHPITYDRHGQPYPTDLARHLRRADWPTGRPMTRRTRADRLAAWLLVVSIGYLGYQILPTILQEIW
jgi:hypothetical protein